MVRFGKNLARCGSRDETLRPRSGLLWLANGDLVVDRWVSPDEGSGYGLATLMDGSPTATGLLKQIRAVRVGLIMRTSLPEKEAVSQDIPTLFADLDSSLHYERKLETDDEKRYRYRTFETTIPVRNTLLK